jgi:glyoxylase-like metal-dependent hydrolase (beta-lactamase superfamily II)
MLHIQHFTFNPFQENTYVVYNDQKEAFIIDPGCYTRIEQKQLLEFIKDHALTPKGLLNTHCHLDHVFGNQLIADTFNLPAIFHKNEQVVLDRLAEASTKWGIPCNSYTGAIQYIENGDTLSLGEEQFSILLTPGHSPGSVCFYHKEQAIIIGGDLIFKDGVGRTDLPGSNPNDLIKSIQDVILPLPENITIYSGHGPATTIGREKRHNPYLMHILNN